MKGQGCDPNMLRAQNLENSWRCYLATIAITVLQLKTASRLPHKRHTSNLIYPVFTNYRVGPHNATAVFLSMSSSPVGYPSVTVPNGRNPLGELVGNKLETSCKPRLTTQKSGELFAQLVGNYLETRVANLLATQKKVAN